MCNVHLSSHPTYHIVCIHMHTLIKNSILYNVLNGSIVLNLLVALPYSVIFARFLRVY